MIAAHPLEKGFRAEKQEACLRAFRPWLTTPTLDEWHLALFPLASQLPLAFFSHAALDKALQFFEANPQGSWQAIAATAQHISHAILSLLMPTPSWRTENVLSLDSPEAIAQFESLWHPEYQRYSEHIFNHLIQVPLHALGHIKHHDYNSPSLANRADLLRANSLTDLTTGFDPVVRNAIAHGKTELQIQAITYADRTASRTLTSWEFEGLFDSLVDTCHGLLAAILIFIARNRFSEPALPSAQLPFGIRYLISSGLAVHPAMKIQDMLESNSPGTGAQLNIVLSTTNPSRAAHQFEAIHIAYVCSCLFPTYDRYFISIDSGKAIQSTIAIDGKALSQASKGVPIEKLTIPLVQTSLLWHDAPKWRSSLSTITTLVRSKWPRLASDLRRSLESSGLVTPVYAYEVVAVENNSSPSGPRLTAYVALLDVQAVLPAQLIATVNHMTRSLRRRRVRRLGISGPHGLPSHPQHITIRLHKARVRLRTMKGMAWQCPELLLIAEWAKRPRSAIPFYTKRADFSEDGMRITFNPSHNAEVAP